MGEKCQDIELQAYLDDELSRNKRARVEAHLAQCDHCKQQLEILELQGSVLREEIEEAAEQADFEGFEDRVLAGIRASRPPSAVQRAGFWLREVLAQYRTVWITSLVTAAVLLLVLIPLMGGSQTGQDQPEGSGPAVPMKETPGSPG